MSDLIYNIVSGILEFLPNDPLSDYLNSLSVRLISAEWLNWLNWFFPVHNIIVVFGLWLSAVLIYKVIHLFFSGFTSFKSGGV